VAERCDLEIFRSRGSRRESRTGQAGLLLSWRPSRGRRGTLTPLRQLTAHRLGGRLTCGGCTSLYDGPLLIFGSRLVAAKRRDRAGRPAAQVYEPRDTSSGRMPPFAICCPSDLRPSKSTWNNASAFTTRSGKRCN